MMNILICGNEKVYPGMELVIYTTLTHNKGVNWYVFTMDIELDKKESLKRGHVGIFKGLNEWHIDKLKKIIKYLDPTSNLTIINTYDLYWEHFGGNPNEYSWLTPYAPLRTLADIALPHVNDLLYLDCDTAVMDNIEDKYWECARNKDNDYYAHFCKDACSGDGEMISGVMFLNLDTIRKTGLFERARENIRNNQYEYYDQCAIRDAGKCEPLDEMYGYIYPLENCPYMPKIIHFTNLIPVKIYDESKGKGRTYFFRRFPFLNYVKEGIELIESINF